MRRSFGPGLLRIDGLSLTLDNAIIDSVLHKGRLVGHAKNSLEVRFVIGKEKFARPFATQVSLPQFRVLGNNNSRFATPGPARKQGLLRGRLIPPGIAKP